MRILIAIIDGCYFGILSRIFGVRAADSPPAKAVPAMEEFKKIQRNSMPSTPNSQFCRWNIEKRRKKSGPTLEKKWKELFSKGEELQAKYFQAAEKAYAEAPNADKELTKLLWNIFDYQIASDDYENAARLGKLLIDNGNGNKRGFAMAGVAAVAMGDFKSAADYFAEGEKAEVLSRSRPTKKTRKCRMPCNFSQNLAAHGEKLEAGAKNPRGGSQGRRSAPRADQNREGRYRRRTFRE